MPLSALREDALARTPNGFELRLSLPWIRSLPASSLRRVTVEIDGVSRPVTPRRGDAHWWHIQDRVVLAGAGRLSEGAHDVTATFTLVIPHVPMGDAPLELPIRESAKLDTRTEIVAVDRDVR